MVYPDDWTCPICKVYVRNEKVCTNCTFPGFWHCPKCGKRMNSTLTCRECGYNPLNPQKSKTVIKRNQVLTFAVIFYAIILGFVIFRIITQDKVSALGELLINEDLSFIFYSFQRLDNAVFTLISPSNESFTYYANRASSSNWVVMNLTLNESGDWTIIVQKIRNGGVSEYSQEFTINSECTLDEHCAGYGEEYECNLALGVCVQHEPGFFDFLKVIGIVRN